MVDINLLPKTERATATPDIWKLAVWLWLPVALAGILIPYLMVSGKANALQAQINATEQEISRLTPQKQEYDQLVQQQNTLQQVTNVAQTLRDQKSYWSNDLARFTSLIPAGNGVSISSMTMEPVRESELSEAHQNGIYVGKQIDRRIRVTGKASSQQAVIDFLNTYESNPNFGAKFQSMQDQESGSYAAVTAPSGQKTYLFNADVGFTRESKQSSEPVALEAAPSTNPVSVPSAPAGGN